MENTHGGNLTLYKNLLGEDAKILDFSSNINPLGIPNSAKNILKDIEQYINIYPDIDYFALRQSISNYTNIDIEKILVGCGATELIHNIINTIKPNKALNIMPAYGEYAIELKKANCEIKEYFLEEKNDFNIDKELLYSYIDIDLVIICNPNNPTGSFIEKNDLFEILSFYKNKNINVLIDETYAEFSRNQSALSLIDEFDNLYIIRGTSKFFGLSGLRLGYIISSNKEILLSMKKNALPWTVNTIAEKIGEVVFQDIDFIENSLKCTEEAMNYFTELIKEVPTLKTFNKNSNLLLVKILNDKKSTEFSNFCLKNNVVIRDLTYYGFKAEGDKFFRISPLLYKENIILGNLLKDFFK
ncbi:MAG: pyridoxal phosphate-dependent aminotransferase [Lachnospirales bacterium]